MTTHLTIPLTEETGARLRTIMEVRSLNSLEAAADYAFAESGRAAGIKKSYDNLLPDERWSDAFDPASVRESLRGPENFPPSRNDAAA